MKKTGKLLIIAAITAAIVFVIAGCENQTMSSNETAYMNSDLSIEKAAWEIVPGMTMTDMYITLAFDEPVRAERASGTWRPFMVNYDYRGSPVTKNPSFSTSFPGTRGQETAVYRFSVMVADGDTADMFSKVSLSYTAPGGFKILTAFDDELKNFTDKPLTKKETGGGMEGM
jgi:hypothetical protein